MEGTPDRQSIDEGGAMAGLLGLRSEDVGSGLCFVHEKQQPSISPLPVPPLTCQIGIYLSSITNALHINLQARTLESAVVKRTCK